MDGEHYFTITHPFHPLRGALLPLLGQRFAWGEERVFFLDPQMRQIRSLPLAWTSLAPPDPFLVVAAGHTVLRLQDAQQLAQFLQQKQAPHREDRSHDTTGSRTSSQSSGMFVRASKYPIASL